METGEGKKESSFGTKLFASTSVDYELLMSRASGNPFSCSRECLLHRERPRRDIRASVTRTVPISDFVNQQALRPCYPTRSDKKIIERNPTIAEESNAERINNVFFKFPVRETSAAAILQATIGESLRIESKCSPFALESFLLNLFKVLRYSLKLTNEKSFNPLR